MSKKEIISKVSSTINKELSNRLPLTVLSVLSVTLIILASLLSLKLSRIETSTQTLVVSDGVVDEIQNRENSGVVKEENKEIVEGLEKISPFIYQDKSEYGFFAIDRESGIKRQIKIDLDSSNVLNILAVPQVNYQGEFFATEHHEGTEDAGHAIVAINSKTGDQRVVFAQEDLVKPFSIISTVSPDQRYIVAVVPNIDQTLAKGSIVVYDLLKEEMSIIDSVREGEYLTDESPDLFGVGNPKYYWTNNTCVTVTIFGDKRSINGTRNTKTYRNYCVE